MNAQPIDTGRPVGDLLREWRRHRRLSQLELANGAELSTRHLSFVESGRAQPSRDMILRLAEYLDVPLRERNALLAAAGFAPAFRQRALDDPALAAARSTIDLLLQGLDDPIVVPSQAEMFRDALVRKGIPHAYRTYAGESHGFRKAATIVDATESELSFYGQVLGFTPPGVPVLELWRGAED